MSRSEPDIVRWLIDWMLANGGAVTEEMALRAERAARAEWGGQTIGYVAKQVDADRQRRIREAAKAAKDGRPVIEAARAHGIGRSTLYRALKDDPQAEPAPNQPTDARIHLDQGGRFSRGRRW